MNINIIACWLKRMVILLMVMSMTVSIALADDPISITNTASFTSDNAGNGSTSASFTFQTDDRTIVNTVSFTSDNADSGSASATFTAKPSSSSAPIVSPTGGTVMPTGSNTEITFVADTFTGIVTIAYAETITATNTDDYITIGKFYNLEAMDGNNQSVQPSQAYTITVCYDPTQLPVGVDERSLSLFSQNEDGSWTKETTSKANVSTHCITATPSHFSTWGVMVSTATGGNVFLPLVVK